MKSNSSNKTHGLIAAALTPFEDNGELAINRIPKLRDFLITRGVKGVFIGGTTGEWPSLTTDERLQLSEAWLTQRKAGLKVFVHVGHVSVREAQRLASQAEELGADSITAVAPLIFKPTTVDGLVDYCSSIAQAAPSLPFYFYHFPALTGMTASGLEILRKATERIPNFRGLKYTHETLADYAECVQCKDGAYDILYGRDEMLLPSLSVGARAAIGSTYNYGSPLSCKIIEAVEAGKYDEARIWQNRANRVLEIADQHGGGKSMMRVLGCDCGPYRAPQTNVSDAIITNLRSELKKENLWHSLQTEN
ncbi:dihydrodipicolinate synthase family protein [Coraliomargarita sp. SDUM461004]|uniref:Dihydrodipicolinate synthase family protein n=1 Tax=Thalassobacterium sedimentorum TaxID=3041258 RepID=A0ABU1AN17_9BACT|nr:dihydrodipicolinate synthase family protein [Coraliomargarita sp. SDUM461004]MDQ8196139.1 dihydrodipicolinate synthase family protein [Coraliomargarita sp. SDUM461004]